MASVSPWFLKSLEMQCLAFPVHLSLLLYRLVPLVVAGRLLV